MLLFSVLFSSLFLDNSGLQMDQFPRTFLNLGKIDIKLILCYILLLLIVIVIINVLTIAATADLTNIAIFRILLKQNFRFLVKKQTTFYMNFSS